MKAVWPRMLAITCLLLILDLSKISQAYLLQRLLEEMAKPLFWEHKEVYYWAGGLSASLILTWMLLENSFLKAELLGVNMKSAVLGMLYKKTLTICEPSISTITSGHVISLFSTDSQKIQEMFGFVYFIVITPVLLGVSTYLLWRELGVSCLAGVGVLIVLVPILSVAGRFFGYMRVRTVKKTDKRMSLMSEILASMQITKMFTWEDSYSTLVKNVRREESAQVMNAQLMRAFNNALYGCSPYLVAMATFVTFYHHGDGHLTVAMVAGTMSIFFAIRMEVTYFFGLGVQGWFEGKASCKRIQKFLMLKEMKTLRSPPLPVNTPSSPSVVCDRLYASWNKGDKEPAVKDVSFTANRKNNLVFVVGGVGTGKTSLLMSLLNELIVHRGSVTINGRVAYSAQQPWVFAGTIRQNILFGKPFKKEFYERVIMSCALAPDLMSFDEGDQTQVGEHGATLSGGQRTRISLARAIYSEADVYLLDDPLSAVDNKVARHIFENCILGLLKNKITILVTHQIQFLEHSTNIVYLQNGASCVEGSLQDLTNRGVNFVSLLHPQTDDGFSDGDSAIDTEDGWHYSLDEETPLRPPSAHDLHGISLNVDNCESARTSKRSFKSAHSSIDSFEAFEGNDDYETIRGAIPYKIYYRYFKEGIGALPTVSLFIAVITGQVLLTLADIWLAEWAFVQERKAQNKTYESKLYIQNNDDNNMYIFVGLSCGAVIGNVVRLLLFFAALVKCSRRLHNQMFDAVLKAPLYFFETNTSGKILNRFSKDIYAMDEELPWTFNDMIQLSFLTLAIFIMNCLSVPYLCILLLPIICFFVGFRHFFVKTSRDLRRLEASSRTPFYNHVISTLDGLSTIRSFALHDVLMEEFNACADYQTEGWLMYLYSMKWFGQRLNFVVTLFSICAIFAPIVLARYIELDEGLVGVSLTYVLLLSGMFQWCVQQSAQVDNLMTSVQRAFQYADLHPERDEGTDKDLRDTWPEYGLLTFESASFSYHKSLPYVLKKIFTAVRPYEKLGIVGRTGSGKSSVLNMLFRLGNNVGTVRIDGYPIADLRLKTLRQSISVIPQCPVLFSGTLRKNLDPFSEHVDGDIWEALDDVQMKDAILNCKQKLDTMVTESGNNWSVGERQLLCLARALLRSCKILFIDEATSNVDNETDALVQETIRRKFKECTVITIAHRLNTVMDSDRIMVLDNGKMVELDEPAILLENSNGYFRKLVDQAGRNEAQRLVNVAEESKRLRHLLLLQSKTKYPGSHITVSKTKAEIINYFGTQVVYETTV
ncbi:ATP-binding cassette sub-family C member 4-like [Clytia hemisphaerica]|uniref:Multidrug resistance-associated protein 4 n=1 Tax=Clytia hemisphaerica TaxID=252671 RepID=A0A7M5V400_9CNID